MPATKSVNALSILALKVKPRIFDLGSFLRHISIRDQLTRARMLARDLAATGQLRPGEPVLVVGAGAAGLAAAEAFAAAGCEVIVVDKATEPLSLWKGVTKRFVGPHMYEWPSVFHDDQVMPAQLPSVLGHWSNQSTTSSDLTFSHPDPVSADALRNQWLPKIGLWPRAFAGQLRIVLDVPKSRIKDQIKRWLGAFDPAREASPHVVDLVGDEWGGAGSVQLAIQPQLIVIAAGFGVEDHRLTFKGKPALDGPRFWQDDALLEPRVGLPKHVAAPNVAVIGGGDGALQDALRALTGDETPMKLAAGLRALKSASVEQCMRRLEAIERQHETGAMWEVAVGPRRLTKALGLACVDEARTLVSDPLVARLLISQIRTDVGRIDLVVDDEYFGKTYPLNRLLVLMYAALGSASTRFTIHWNERVVDYSTSYATPPSYDLQLRAGTLYDVNRLAIRISMKRNSAPGQMLGVTRKDTVNRRELAEIKLPFSLVR